MTTYDVLVKARAYLLEHGWTQGTKGTKGGPVCVSGACYFGADEDYNSWTSSFRAFATATGMRGQRGAVAWNDTEGRTFEEVIAAFDRAIRATAPPREDTPIFTALEDLPAEAYLDCLSTLALIPAEALA